MVLSWNRRPSGSDDVLWEASGCGGRCRAPGILSLANRPLYRFHMLFSGTVSPPSSSSVSPITNSSSFALN